MELEPDVEVLAYGLREVYRVAARLAEGAGDLPGPVPLRVDLAALR